MREVQRCKKCKRIQTHDMQLGSVVCTRCRLVENIQSATRKLEEIQKFLQSGAYLDDVKELATWNKRRKYPIIFDDKDPLKDVELQDAHIMLIPSKYRMSHKDFALVGKTEKGWWRRHGYLYKTFKDKPTHEIKVSDPLMSYQGEYYWYSREEALAKAVFEAMRPLLL